MRLVTSLSLWQLASTEVLLNLFLCHAAVARFGWLTWANKNRPGGLGQVASKNLGRAQAPPTALYRKQLLDQSLFFRFWASAGRFGVLLTRIKKKHNCWPRLQLMLPICMWDTRSEPTVLMCALLFVVDLFMFCFLLTDNPGWRASLWGTLKLL